MIALGLLPIGTHLSIKGKANSEATLIDHQYVNYRGERLRINEWGQRVTGWSAIQIYVWVLLPNGEPLQSLRNVAAERVTKEGGGEP